MPVRRLASRFLAALSKELHLNASPVATLLGRVILGPAVSLLLSGSIYFGIFSSNPNINLKGLNKENYLSFLAVGFLFQNIIHSGYFSFSQRILSEIAGKTFSVVWLSGPWRSLNLLMLGSIDNIRCLVFGGFVLWVGKVSFTSYGDVISFLLWFVGAIGLGCLLGGVRVFVYLLARDWLDLLDSFYLLLSFGSCAFIPATLFPDLLNPLIKVNGLYWYLALGRSIVESNVDLLTISAAFSTVLCFFFVVILVWNYFKIRLMDRCFC